ncbi:hypothetical protein D3C81_1199740 [compost metagenome]
MHDQYRQHRMPRQPQHGGAKHRQLEQRVAGNAGNDQPAAFFGGQLQHGATDMAVADPHIHHQAFGVVIEQALQAAFGQLPCAEIIQRWRRRQQAGGNLTGDPVRQHGRYYQPRVPLPCQLYRAGQGAVATRTQVGGEQEGSGSCGGKRHDVLAVGLWSLPTARVALHLLSYAAWMSTYEISRDLGGHWYLAAAGRSVSGCWPTCTTPAGRSSPSPGRRSNPGPGWNGSPATCRVSGRVQRILMRSSAAGRWTISRAGSPPTPSRHRAWWRSARPAWM